MNNNGLNPFDDNILLSTMDTNVKAVWNKNKHEITGFWDNGVYKESNQADERLQMLGHTASLKERVDLK